MYADVSCMSISEKKIIAKKLKPILKNDQCIWKKWWQFIETDGISKTACINKANDISIRNTYNEITAAKVIGKLITWNNYDLHS